uniref:7TM_GPCR_Srx domain-containing protein n=1 Tax=Steinernema glaseri TaxID=37863 RepID=A0A1I7YKB0_9BILA
MDYPIELVYAIPEHELTSEFPNTTQDEYDDDFEHRQPLAASILATTIYLSAVVVHAYILQRILFRKVFGRLFGWMWISREIGLLTSCLIGGLIYGPSIVLYPDIYEKLIGMYLAKVCIILLLQIALSTLLIAFNRCLLIRKPLNFKHIFTPKKTAYMITLSWAIPIGVITAIQCLPFDDSVTVDGEVVPLYFFIQVLLFLFFVYLILVVTLVIDMYAIWKLRQMSKIVLQSLVAVPASFIELAYESIFWNITLTLDGLIIIYFNDDLHPWKSSQRPYKDTRGNMHRVNTNGSICTTIVD